MNDDREVLIGVLQTAAHEYTKKHPRPTLIGPDPDDTIIEPISNAILRCSAFESVAMDVLYTGGSTRTVDSTWLAGRVFERGIRWGNDIPAAAEWLLRVLSTREVDGFFKAAIWGLIR